MSHDRITLRVLLAAMLVLGCTAHDAGPPHPIKAGASAATSGYQAGPAISGSWYDPARSGEGFVLQMLPDGRPLLFWFTYPPVGVPGEQAWLIAQDGVVDGSSVRFDTVLRPVGARFGDAFDPAAVDRQHWGSLQLEFSSCSRATVRYAGPAGWGSGTRTLSRLTSLSELDCAGSRTLTGSGAPALAGLRARSGSWYVPERSGEGWAVEELGNGQSLVYWFTYSPDGQQAWTIGQGVHEGDQLRIEHNQITRGTRFGDDFDAAAVQRIQWGRLDLAFSSCERMRAGYASDQPAYGDNQRSAVRLTRVAGTGCVDGTPQPPSQVRWTERARMPTPWPSELAVSVLDDQLYALGGFGARRSVRRYDPASDSWSPLPDLPSGRDHLAAYALDDTLYMTGGAPDAGDDPQLAGYRFDAGRQAWTPEAALPPTFGSHAAVLGGRAYIGDVDGSLVEHDPRSGSIRVIAPAGSTGRDHSQVLAFMGEIWLIAGRFPETASVSIYDPVRDRWRSGPPLNHPRGGFAAAVVGNRLVVAGGEVLGDGPRPRLEGSVEVYTAGSERWLDIGALPIPVHGTAAGTVAGQFHLVSGSTAAGQAFGATGRLFALELGP